MPDVRELQAGESRLAALALGELRPQFGSSEALVRQIDRQRTHGYRLAASFDADDPNAAAVAGFRILENLAWGRFLYVDDLITRSSLRGRGHADAVFAWLEHEARDLECDQLHLDSGVGPHRNEAHRFYLNHRLRISSHHFARPVDIVLVD